MVAEGIVPELEIAHPGAVDVRLPERAESDVEVWHGNDGFQAYGYEADGHSWAQLPGIGVFRFRDDDSGVVAFPDRGVPESLVEDAYRRNVLPLVLHLRGFEVLHASAVSAAGRVLGLCGVSGSGKSTLARGLSLRGHELWADDALVVDIGDSDATALGVPFRLRLHGPAASHFPPAPAEPTASSSDEAAQAPLRALAVLARRETAAHGAVVEVGRLSPTEAFTALLPHAYYFRLSDLHRNARMVDRYLRLASLTPVVEVRYRSGFEHVSDVLDAVEAHLFAG